MTDPAQPPKTGLSTGQKVLIGCLGVTVFVALGIAAVVVVGGVFMKDRMDDFMGGVERQQEASQTMDRLAREHPFDAPEDGVVTQAQLERFVTVTETAWEDMRPWAEELAELDAASEAPEEQGLAQLARGARALGGFAGARVELAEALDEVGMSLGEYLWTGISLSRAFDVVEGDEAPGAVPEENVALAEAHRDDLAILRDPPEGEPHPGLVLAVAIMSGTADPAVWQAYGLDTLTSEGGR